MTEVREVLAEQGVELVLLIEDFAKLQGIEHQLLEALLVRSSQEGRRPLCGIRTALACTSGYFGAFKETVLQRATFTVNLDIDTQATHEMARSGEIERFVARYLNAVRQPAQVLKTWREESLTGDTDVMTPPNACEECPHQQGCHRAFGESGGMGLYPFGATAIDRMRDRVSPGKFVPRLLIKDVLKHTLETYTDDLVQGRFPSPGLRAHFSGGKAGLPLALTDQIHRKDRVNADRRAVLLEFWSPTSQQLVDLDPFLHEAFSLPPLGVARQDPTPVTAKAPPTVSVPNTPVASPPQTPAPVQPPPRVDPQDEQLADHLSQLGAWLNGGPLTSKLTHRLRDLLHPAITGHSRWDSELLLIKYFAGDKETFQPKSINFRRQSLQPQHTALFLELPERDSPEAFRDCAFALEGLLRFERHGHWAFPGGARYQRVFTAQLERWVRRLLTQIQSPTTSAEPFDPVPAAVELLALGARMSGRPASTKSNTVEELGDVLFTDWPAVGDARGPKWKELSRLFAKERAKLQQIVVSRTACTKGGAKSARVLDAVRIAPALERLRKDWRPRESLPEDLSKGELEVLARLRQKVDELLESALDEEQARHLTWGERVVEALGPEAEWKDFVTEVHQVMEKTRNAGVFAGSVPELQEALARVENLTPSASATLTSIERMREQESGKRIVELSRDLQSSMSAVQLLLERVQRFLAGSSSRVDTELSQLRASGGQQLEDTRDAITATLVSMETLAEALKRSET